MKKNKPTPTVDSLRETLVKNGYDDQRIETILAKFMDSQMVADQHRAQVKDTRDNIQQLRTEIDDMLKSHGIKDCDVRYVYDEHYNTFAIVRDVAKSKVYVSVAKLSFGDFKNNKFNKVIGRHIAISNIFRGRYTNARTKMIVGEFNYDTKMKSCAYLAMFLITNHVWYGRDYFIDNTGVPLYVINTLYRISMGYFTKDHPDVAYYKKIL